MSENGQPEALRELAALRRRLILWCLGIAAFGLLLLALGFFWPVS
jgi:hypothetical protein